MEEIDRINIQTTSSEGQTLQTVVNNGPINLTTQVSDVPQIQTVLQDNISPIASVINNPFVEVTSVNGMTGDVITEAEILDFISNHFYKKNTLISHSGNLYWAKQDFTSGSSFDVNDWNLIEATGVSEWDDIQNKPTFATVATSGLYNDLSGKPNLASVATSGSYNDLSDKPSINNGSLTIKRNNTLLGTFTANSSSNVDVNVSVPVQISDLTNDDNYLRGEISQTISQIPSVISTSMIQNNAVTNGKINWNDVINGGSDGEYILIKNGSNIGFASIPYRVGDTLVVAANTAQLEWAGTAKVLWSVGDWLQYGPMAKTTGPSEIMIKTPVDESWDVKLHHITGTVKIPSSSWSHSGLYQGTASLTPSSFLTSCLVANGDLYLHQETETVVTIPANTTRYFGVWVRTNSTATCIWYGGGATTSTGSNFNFGTSCVLDATLVGRRKV